MKLKFTAEQETLLCEQFGIGSISEIHPEQLPFLIEHITKHAKQEERFRIVQLISNLPDGSIENTTWGEIARLIEAPEGESK